MHMLGFSFQCSCLKFIKILSKRFSLLLWYKHLITISVGLAKQNMQHWHVNQTKKTSGKEILRKYFKLLRKAIDPRVSESLKCVRSLIDFQGDTG